MSIDKKRFDASAFLASLFFIFGTVLGIIRFVQVLPSRTLPTASIINISADIGCMALGYVLFIVTIVDRSKNEENLNAYLLLLFTCFCSAFLDEVCWIVDGKERYIYLNTVANTLYFMGAPVMAYLFWRYVISYLGLELKKVRKFTVFLSVGLVVAVVIRVINPLFGYYFYIKPDGTYQRGPLYLISNLYAYTTMIFTLILIFLARKKFKVHQIITLYLYAFFPLAIGVFTVFTFGLSLSSPVIMLVLLLMYCVLNVFQSRERSLSDRELQMASTIQGSMLPHVFPPFPDRHEFDLHATMNAAKEVGGDFYDFYMPDSDHLVITIADVSGKGVPAALMMMVTKTLLKNRGLTDFNDCAKILSSVNNQLCGANDLNMFVTVWIGILTISTGELVTSNAGHEYPAIMRAGGEFELIKGRHSPPIGCVEDINYKIKTFKLNPGDIIYIYTDGVTDANNADRKLFGENRLLEALNLPGDKDVVSINRRIKDCLNSYMEGTEQFDDITMLCLKYNGANSKEEPEINDMKQLKVNADISELDNVLSFADTILEEAECPAKAQMQIDIAIEEIFVNIAHYAYPEGQGQATILINADPEAKSVEITFEDEGIPYDPLKNEDPDITLSADDRPIGGLGIFMVKKSMDDMSYEYKDGKNRLTIKKSF
ncbi:MAG: SpoIIE family protein phosphatase [Clostridiales bacterium]|nr:SpoIIE family protein phosphatase [Clostridiales bacterium]